MGIEIDIGGAIGEMVRVFIPHCRETSTLLELDQMVSEPAKWCDGHGLFSRIRSKTLMAIEAKDELLQWQYAFEEICAKTLFNLSDVAYPAPFDDDAPFWVIPLALSFARALGMEDPYSVSSLLQPAVRRLVSGPSR